MVIIVFALLNILSDKKVNSNSYYAIAINENASKT